MSFVRVEQRNAHLAGAVRLEFVNGRDGMLAKATVTAISNHRRGSGEEREEEATAILWTLWGKQAENAAEYLGEVLLGAAHAHQLLPLARHQAKLAEVHRRNERRAAAAPRLPVLPATLRRPCRSCDRARP